MIVGLIIVIVEIAAVVGVFGVFVRIRSEHLLQKPEKASLCGTSSGGAGLRLLLIFVVLILVLFILVIELFGFSVFVFLVVVVLLFLVIVFLVVAAFAFSFFFGVFGKLLFGAAFGLFFDYFVSGSFFSRLGFILRNVLLELRGCSCNGSFDFFSGNLSRLCLGRYFPRYRGISHYCLIVI